MQDPKDIARFTTAQAAAACRMTAVALGLRLTRGGVALADDEPAEVRNPGAGRSRLFSARRVLHLALTEELARIGLPVSTASRLALRFTDVGGTDQDKATLADEPDIETRASCELIAGAQTVFRVLFPGDGGEPVARVDALPIGNPLMADNLAYTSVVLIDLNVLRHRVFATLGVKL